METDETENLKFGNGRQNSSLLHVSGQCAYIFMQRGVAYKKLNQQVSLKHALHEQDYLSNKRQKFDGILMIYVYGFGLRPLLEVILYRLLSFGGMLAVRSREVSATRRF